MIISPIPSFFRIFSYPMKYLSFLNGTYSTAPGLIPSSKASGADKLIFQIDDTYNAYIDNKRACRREGIGKYYLENRFEDLTRIRVNQYFAQQIRKEHPEKFRYESGDVHRLVNTMTGEAIGWSHDWKDADQYASLFDALCSQVQEDVAVVQLKDEDYVCAIHLCAPNHWDPADKIGRPFYEVHAPVPAMERTVQHYRKMLQSIIGASGSSTRFAWGIATDTRLNHHPVPPHDADASTWAGRLQERDATWYVRSERQNLIGLPEVNAFIFTIRTYHYPVHDLTTDERVKLKAAITSMSPESLRYKGLDKVLPFLDSMLP